MKRLWILILIAGIALAALSAYQYMNRLSAGDPAPPFFLQKLDGGTVVTLEEFRGKPFILHFWATWCGVCRVEFPSLGRFARELEKEGVAVLAVSVDGKEGERLVREYFRDPPAGMILTLDSTGEMANAYQSYGVPETLVIGADGIVVWRNDGPVDWDRADVRAKIRTLVH